MVSKRYFGWTGSLAGFLIASLGALVLPAHFVVERASRSFDERAIMKFSLIFITVSTLGILNYDTLYYDLVAGSNYVEHVSVESLHTVKNVSIADWQTAKNASIEDWHSLRDPLTWEQLLNETEQDWQQVENMTTQEWTVFQNATKQEWEKLQKERAEEWGKLSEGTKEKYFEFTNATQKKWEELRKDTKSEWSHLINGTESEWEKVNEVAVNEWEKLPNQTEAEWQKLKYGGRYEWDHIGEQTRSEWDHIGKQTHNLLNATEELFDRTKDSVAQKAGEVRDVTTTKWNEFGEDAGQKGGQWRDATAAKWGDWSAEISNVLDGVTNTSTSVIHTAKERTRGGETRLLKHNDDRLRRLHRHHQRLPYDWNYGFYAYLIGMSAIFMGTIILEGVDTSLMCKTAPSKLNSTFINVGLLASMVGTFGRVLGDGLITLSALIGLPRHYAYTDFVNSLFLPLIPITLLGLYLVRRNYLALI